jgi:deoxyadenosine/deoxycytidine kinase
MELPAYIAIEGNIGAGKTTFCRLFAKRYNRRLILEEFTDNPFLPLFYQDPERYGFPVELFFMAERHKQLQTELSRGDLFQEGLVADYLFVKTRLFASNSLSDAEYRLFNRLYTAMDAGFPTPDITLYLHRPIEVLQHNIAERGRSYETDISTDYLLSIQRAYFQYFRQLRRQSVVVCEIGDGDFTGDSGLFERLVDAAERPHPPGMSTVRFE